MPAIHTMERQDEHENTETWICPACGRVVLVEWNPFRLVMVEPGTETNTHHAGMTVGLSDDNGGQE